MELPHTPRHRRSKSPRRAAPEGVPHDPSALRGITQRSRVTNGNQLFVELRNGNSSWTRRLRDLIADAASDLGGSDVISAAERVLVRRAAMLTLQCELMEQRWAENG